MPRFLADCIGIRVIDARCSRQHVKLVAGDDGTLTFLVWCDMARCVGAAATLSEGDRKDLAIQALARSATICDLSDRHGVSRKFVYQQAHKACAALDDVFLSGTPE